MSTYTAFDNNPVFWADPSGADAYNEGHGDEEGRRDSHSRVFMNQGKHISVTDRGGLSTENSLKKEDSGGSGDNTNCCGNGLYGLRMAFFKSFFPENGAANDFIDHYANGNGESYTLNQKQMLEIYPTMDGDATPIDLSLNTIDMLSVGKLSPGESKTFEDHIEVYAGSSGTLGHFTLTRKGMITLNEETGKREFNGSFIFDDIYDFNASNHRPWDAELQVTVARNFLPGRKFDVKGKMSVHQIQGEQVTTKFNGLKISPLQYPKLKNTQERKDASKF